MHIYIDRIFTYVSTHMRARCHTPTHICMYVCAHTYTSHTRTYTCECISTQLEQILEQSEIASMPPSSLNTHKHMYSYISICTNIYYTLRHSRTRSLTSVWTSCNSVYAAHLSMGWLRL